MSGVNWGNYAEAYKAIHDKLDEILMKLDYPVDPAVQDVIDRADRVLGRVYGSQGQPLAQESASPYPLLASAYGDKGAILKQRIGTKELLVQLVHQGTEYQAGGGGGSGLVQCQIRNEADDAWINEPYARDISDRASRDLGKVAVLYDILAVVFNIDEIDYAWNADGTLNTKVYKKGASAVLTLTYTWNADGTLQKVVRT